MADIKVDFNSGGNAVNPKEGTAERPSFAMALRDAADDFETIRLALNALNAKLDADVGITDIDYASLLDIATGGILTKKV